MFVDKVTVSIQAGRGGDGYMSFRNEKYVDKGGPDGGDGGDGGDVIAVASNNQNTLAAFRYNKRVVAEDGAKGFNQNKHGKSAEDLLVPLPVGTVIYDSEGNLRADLKEEGQQVVIAYGGRGGFGNAHFTSSVRQAPKFAEKGEDGESYEAVFELKLIAEVGLIGLPNAGKSTFLSVVTNAKPEIANYPFTTIKPNLGVVDMGEGRSMLLADIPGLIEGASEGKGLGDDFLRHVERTRLLLHCVDAYSTNPAENYTVVRRELAQYSADVAARPEIILLTKTDGLDKEVVDMQVNALKAVTADTKIIPLSAQTHEGVKQALWDIYTALEAERAVMKQEAEAADNIAVIKPDFKELEWVIEKVDGGYVIKGRKLERFAMRTDTENEEALRRLRDILRKKGVLHELKRQGAVSGDAVYFGAGRRTRIEL